MISNQILKQNLEKNYLTSTYIIFLNPIWLPRLLTVVVDGEGHVGGDDVVEADLAVLRGAVGVQGLHAHDAVEQAALGHGGLVAPLHEHGGELVDVVDAHVHRGPGDGGERDREAGDRGIRTTWCLSWERGVLAVLSQKHQH